MNLFLLLLLVAAAVVVFDIAASFASRSFGFPYGFAAIGSVVVYATSGFAAFRTGGLGAACAAGFVAGLVDGTLGWRISWVIGPGRTPDGTLTASEWFTGLQMAVVMALACAAGGAWLASHGS